MISRRFRERFFSCDVLRACRDGRTSLKDLVFSKAIDSMLSGFDSIEKKARQERVASNASRPAARRAGPASRFEFGFEFG